VNEKDLTVSELPLLHPKRFGKVIFGLILSNYYQKDNMREKLVPLVKTFVPKKIIPFLYHDGGETRYRYTLVR